jgi:hypothetical protein
MVLPKCISEALYQGPWKLYYFCCLFHLVVLNIMNVCHYRDAFVRQDGIHNTQWMRNNSDRLWISPLLEGRKTIGITSQKHLFNPLEPELSSQLTLHKNQDLNGCNRVYEFVVDIISECLVLQHNVLCWLESTFDAIGLN